MRRILVLPLVALALLSGCSRQSAEVGAAKQSPGSPAPGTVHTDEVTTTSTAAPTIAWFPSTVDEAFAEAQAKNKPVFLFWHAAWCPYCQDLKASVFTRSDVIAKLGFFIPVSLDGDLPGAQKVSEQFHVNGYPTVLVLKGDRTELARISGGMDLNRYAEVLDVVLGDVRPVKDILTSLENSKAMLTANDCRRLAFNAWTLDPANVSGPAELKNTSQALARAAERCPPAQEVERARLITLATAAATDSEEETIKAGKPVSEHTASLVDGVRKLLDDTAVASAVVDSLQELSENFFLAAKARSPDAGQELLAHWNAVMDAATEDARYSEGQKLAAAASEVDAARTLDAKGQVPAALAASAKARVRETLSHKHDAFTRAAVVNAAIDILETLNELQQAHAMVEAELKTANAPYYYMSHLASIDEKMGNKAEAVEWLKRAYDESKGPVTRFRWGTNYIVGLVRMQPESAASIREATLTVLAELNGPDALNNSTTMRLKRISTTLSKWNASQKHNDVISAARARLTEICAKSTTEASAADACKEFLAG